MSWVLNEEVLAVLAAIVLVSAVFAGIQAFNAGRVIEPFSELGLLGPGGKIGDYPKQVVAGLPFQLNVYIGNHEGKTVYYRVLVKLGDKASTINETNPLQAEPMMEVRAVLSHNMSQTIPINVTLNRAATGLRLVFEMWIFNETSGAFSYHGRWNQLWLNVTEPTLGVPPPQPYRPMSPEMESKIVEGYLSIRRAEDAGGDVSDMVNLLNRALRLAGEGREAEAESLIDQVLDMEPEVSRLGLEAGRTRLITSLGALAAALTAGVCGFLYLRRRVWVYWARLHKGWRIMWIGGSSKLSSLEKAISDHAKSSNGLTVEALVFSPRIGYKPNEAARALYGLARKGALRLVDQNPPKSFAAYILSWHNLGLIVAALLVFLCIFSVYASALTPILAAPRIVLGSLFTLFLPGYSLVEALYPREDELSPLERLALSIGLSLALVPLVGLILNYTPWGIRLDPTMVGLSALTLLLLLASAYRKYQILKLEAAAEIG